MGHYAGVTKKQNNYYLTKAKDINKDQTYFLCWLNQNQLKHATFPIGNLTKENVRKIAKEIGLENWSKKDSTGICFIGERDFKKFLNNYLPYKQGDVVDIATHKKIGKHDGVIFYTYGQNKGLSLSGQKQKYYVCQKDLKKNILYVCNESQRIKYLSSTSCELIKFNWINTPPTSKHIQIRFRHRQELINGVFKINKTKVLLNYDKTLMVTPGQFAVIYQNKFCLGGGIVNKLIK
jgi:tRNA-specific 2-thiouridylase